MKIKLEELKNAEQSLIFLAGLDFDIDVSYSVMNVVDVAAIEIKKINNFINKLIFKFGEDVVINGKPEKQITRESLNFPLYIKNVEKLMKKEIDLPITRLSKDFLTGHKISAQHLKRLEKFFDDYKEKKLELVKDDDDDYDFEIEES